MTCKINMDSGASLGDILNAALKKQEQNQKQIYTVNLTSNSDMDSKKNYFDKDIKFILNEGIFIFDADICNDWAAIFNGDNIYACKMFRSKHNVSLRSALDVLRYLRNHVYGK